MTSHGGLSGATAFKSQDVHSRLVDIFQRFDTRDDGTISSVRLKRALEKLNLEHHSIKLVMASFGGMGAERIDYTKFASWVTDFQDGRLLASQEVRSASGRAVLLRASWLAPRCRQQAAALPRREELPPEACWDVGELFEMGEKMLQMLNAGGHSEFLPIVSVSLRGADEGQLKNLALTLELFCTYLQQAFKEIDCPADCAVFLPACSWSGAPTEKQVAEQVSDLGLWFGHTLVRKLLIPGKQHAQEEGLACLESLLSGLISQHQMVLRLDDKTSIQSFRDWSGLRKACVVGRSPPITPEAASELLESKHFQGPVQRKAAKQCYRTTFQAAVDGCQQLVLARLGWGDEDMNTLSKVLPTCTHLRDLFLEGNRIGDEGARYLGEVLPKCQALQEVLLGKNFLGDAGAEQLCKALPSVSHLQRLELQTNKVTEVTAGRLAAILPKLRCLQDLLLQDNQLLDGGVKALADKLPESICLKRLVLDRTGAAEQAALSFCQALGKCPRLQLLHLEGNPMADSSCKAVRDAWCAAGKPDRCDLNHKRYPALMT